CVCSSAFSQTPAPAHGTRRENLVAGCNHPAYVARPAATSPAPAPAAASFRVDTRGLYWTSVPTGRSCERPGDVVPHPPRLPIEASLRRQTKVSLLADYFLNFFRFSVKCSAILYPSI